MKTLLLTAAVVLFSLSLVACEGGTKKSETAKFEVVPSVSFPAAVNVSVTSTSVDNNDDKCPWANAPYTGDTKVLAKGSGFQINCGKMSGMVVVAVDETVDLDTYRRVTKVAIDESLCTLFGSKDVIGQKVSWALTGTFELSELLPSDEQPSDCTSFGK